jgi:CheY-like chemotaxis protein
MEDPIRVLVSFEDDLAGRALRRVVMQTFFAEVRCAKSHTEAASCVADWTPDVLFLSVEHDFEDEERVLPEGAAPSEELDELLRAARVARDGAPLPIVALSWYVGDVRVPPVLAGERVVAVVPPPTEMDRLVDALTRACGRSPVRR